jgi:surface antigen
MKNVTLMLILLVAALSLKPFAAGAGEPPQAKAAYVGFTGKKWPKDYGVAQGRCDTRAVAAAVSRGEERAIAVIVGAALGKRLDESDRGCMGHALELASLRQTVAWTNAATGVSYRLTPTGAFKDGALTCRRFAAVVASGKGKESVKAAACRQGSGEWLFRSA